MFSGGCDGIMLGLQWVGLGPLTWHAESDARRRLVLARHWPPLERHPYAKIFDDVRAVTADTAPWASMICGGFPCTGFSNAGKRKGFDDERSALWSEFVRVAGELRPLVAFVENTAAAVPRGWLRVLADLVELGFDAEWCTLRGTDVGWPVRRDRVFLLACAGEVGRAKLREAHDLDGCDAPGDLAHRRGACRPPPGPGDLAALRAWAAEHGGVEPGFRRNSVVVPERVERVGSLGDSAMPVLVAHAFRTLRDRFLAAA